MEVDDLTNEEFDKLCMETIENSTGIRINVGYEDPCVTYFNPDINDKNKDNSVAKENTFKVMK